MTASEAGGNVVRLLVLEGDGIGPEITAATLRVLHVVGDRVGVRFEVEHQLIGLAALEQHGTTFPAHVLERVPSVDGLLLGPVDHAAYPPPDAGGRNPSGELRKHLDLYANIRPARSRPGVTPPCGRPVDLVVVRENTEGFYADRSMHTGPGEFMPTPDVAMSLRKVTRAGSIRIAAAAFELASRREQPKVTAVHKANVLRLGDGLFLDCVREVAADFPAVEYEERLVDAVAALLIRDASQFDVLVTTNMFGDILSDQASELSGSLGLAASLNRGQDTAVAQAQHGSAPDIAGRGLANPSSLIGSAAMLLDWLADTGGDDRLAEGAKAIDDALSQVLAEPEQRTPDLGGPRATMAFADLVAEAVAHPIPTTKE